MKILNRDTLTNINSYPYFYYSSYALFVKQSEKKNIIIFVDENKNTICCKLWKNKFLNYVQLIYPPLDKNAERVFEKDEKLFLENLIEYFIKNKLCNRICQPENFAIFNTVPDDAISSPFGTYVLNLSEYTKDELFKKLHTKHRNVIKNAEKNNVELKYGRKYIDDFYLLYKQTMQRSNMYCQDISYFQNFYNSMPDNIICGVAYYNNIPQGALFMPFTKYSAFYLYGASAEKMEINGVITYLHWNTIKMLKEKDVKRYDFVGARLSDVTGTKLHGIQQFKERFGGTLEKGFLWKMDINKLKCVLFDTLVNLKLKVIRIDIPKDIIDQELEKHG
ncbi:MAG: peptidoglycan bridge formation glycyltransferase FemA/FemB family protein [Bacteroidia bacterium]